MSLGELDMLLFTKKNNGKIVWRVNGTTAGGGTTVSGTDNSNNL